MVSPITTSTHPLRHVAIIMDGNGRWAKERSLPPLSGHQIGAERLEEVLECCNQENVKYLTVFAFSSENWNRPASEVGGLMSLLVSALKRNRKRMKKEGVRLKVIGRRDRLSERLRTLISDVEEYTQAGDAQLTLAVDYGGRWDIANAAKLAAQDVERGVLSAESIDEEVLSRYMGLADLPDPDLLIRTGFERRISNFLLWQISYSELYFANCHWPDFDKNWFQKAIDSYRQRERRFGFSTTEIENAHFDRPREVQSA